MIAEGLYSGVQTEERKPIDLPQTGRLKFFQSEWEKISADKTVLNYVKGLKIPFISKPIQNKIPDSTPESLTEFNLLKKRNRQINTSERSNTSGQCRTWVICEPPFHSSKVKWSEASCDQFEATKQT